MDIVLLKKFFKTFGAGAGAGSAVAAWAGAAITTDPSIRRPAALLIMRLNPIFILIPNLYAWTVRASILASSSGVFKIVFEAHSVTGVGN
ncbi:hypothetical protein [Cryobacterium sp. PH31-O1]|uniref:hypothetical protein n=1 Tax=Cryobacterium sp. PH31-O1 TaxID=3046306 RepID=UPI0024BAABC7|nr:hypothetical protein [Cryobacterium sp. PH31-O1]MDJ0337152.1 hypothetical protein [Cryobacterium sp. PH31-O1]